MDNTKRADGAKTGKLPRGKRMIFAITLLVAAVLFLELASWFMYLAVRGRRFSYSEMKEAMTDAAGVDLMAASEMEEDALGEFHWGDFIEVTHPYVGYVANPKNKGIAISDHGFISDIDSIQKRSKDTIIIGISGGSFARQMYTYARTTLVETLAPLEKEVVMVNMGMGGYKQPQQLAALTYLLALGAEFDIVVNLDGFNEVALPYAENLRKGVFPAFPRGWYYRVANLNELDVMTKLARLELLNRSRKEWAGRCVGAGVYRSTSLSLVWRARDRSMEKEINEIRLAINEYRASALAKYASTGPAFKYENDIQYFRHLADLWQRGSLQMHNLCNGNDIRYYHFLQPNQYVEGSKPMSEEERKIAINPRQPYRHGVLVGYPMLRESGKELIAQGVDFNDLALIFSDVEEIVYRDDACHLNERGYAIIADRIGKTILEDPERREK